MRMRITAVFVALVLVTLAGSVLVGAQTNMVVGYEAELMKLGAMRLDHRNVGEPCGPYFRFTGVPREAGKVGTLVLVASSIGKDGVPEISIPMLGTDKFQLRVVSGLKVPRIKVLRRGGPVLPWVEIMISPADYRQAPCLSHVAVLGSVSAH